MSLRGLFIVFVGLLLSAVPGREAHAQEQPAVPDTTAQDTTRRAPPPDSVDRPPERPDSLTQTPPEGAPERQTSRPPGAGPGPGGSGDAEGSSEAVTFSARDSMVIRSTPSGENHGTLHGNASMSYQEASLKARTIEMNFQTSTLRAEGAPSDTAQGGRPRFQRGGGGGQSGSSPGPPGGAGSGGRGATGPPGGLGSQGGGQSFTGDVLSYNLNTKRGRVVAARTNRSQGYVEGGAVKIFEDSTLFVQDGTYTTCDCETETPSYSLRSTEMKLQDRWVYTGPIQLYLFNIPTPLWLPFGFLPNVEGRRSGPLAPEYGEDRRGFYLRNWGWYFALNQYTDLTIQAGVWSQGSYEIRPRFRYRKRYNYDGDLRLTYRRERIGEDVDPNFQNRHEGQLRWNHSQDLSPTASLNGDVDLATSSDFARRNSDNYNDAVRQDVSSSINYRKRWPNGGRQLSISANQDQQLGTAGAVNLTLPNLGFSQNSFKPFQQEQRIGEERWYEKITTSYQLDVQNSYNFDPRDPQQLRRNGTPADSALADSVEQADIDWYEAMVDRQKYRLATGDDELYDFQATHRIPLNMSFRVDRYNLTISPNVRYNNEMYINTVRRTARRDSTGDVGDIVERSEPGFYARHDFSTSLSTSSEVYGTFPVGVGAFQGLRHRLSPSLSMNYQPNFNDPFWGRTRALRFADGTPVIRDSTTGEVARYDIVDGGRVRRSTQQWSLNMSLRNVFETKRVTTDTTGRENTERVQLLNLDVTGLSYNFAADSFRVGNNINVNARTRIDPFNVSVRSSFSPYALRRTSVGRGSRFRRVDRLMVAESPLTPLRLTRFQFNLSADFSSRDGGGSVGRGSQGRGRRGRSQSQSNRPNQQERPQDGQDTGPPTQLSELNIPWSLNFSFNYGLQKRRKEVTNRSATLSVDFNINLTPLWRIRGNTGYDFVDGEMSTTRISINRQLCCWNMSLTWVPFGEFQQYGFNLQVSSGQLSQLLQLQIPNQGGEGRLGGFGDQLRGTVQGAAGAGGRGRGGGFR